MPRKNQSDKDKEYSGHVSLRLPIDLHKALALKAEKNKASLNTYIVSILSRDFHLEEL